MAIYLNTEHTNIINNLHPKCLIYTCSIYDQCFIFLVRHLIIKLLKLLNGHIYIYIYVYIYIYIFFNLPLRLVTLEYLKTVQNNVLQSSFYCIDVVMGKQAVCLFFILDLKSLSISNITAEPFLLPTTVSNEFKYSATR